MARRGSVEFCAIPQAWSIGCIIWFYLMAPFMMKLRNCWIAIVGLTSLALDTGMTRAGFDTHYFFPALLYFFMIGILLQRAYVMFDLPNVDHRAGYVAAAIMLAAFVLCPMIPSALQGLFLYATLIPAIPFLFALTLKSRMNSFLSDLSWPIYMVHMLVITIARQDNQNAKRSIDCCDNNRGVRAIVIASRTARRKRSARESG